MTSDITVISAFIALLLISIFTDKLPINQVGISFMYYCSTVICASLLMSSVDAWALHAIYALLAAPFIFISSIFAATTILIYALFNLLISIDYIFYLNIDTIVSINFASSQLFFALALVIGSMFKGAADDHRIAISILDCVGRYTDIHRSIQKMEKNQ